MDLQEAKDVADRYEFDTAAEKVAFIKGLRCHPHADALAEALTSATKTLTAERDLLWQSVTVHGRYHCDVDRENVAAWDAELDGYRAVLERAGKLTPAAQSGAEFVIVATVATERGNATRLTVTRRHAGGAAVTTLDLGEWPLAEHAVQGAAAMALDVIYSYDEAAALEDEDAAS